MESPKQQITQCINDVLSYINNMGMKNDYILSITESTFVTNIVGASNYDMMVDKGIRAMIYLSQQTLNKAKLRRLKKSKIRLYDLSYIPQESKRITEEHLMEIYKVMIHYIQKNKKIIIVSDEGRVMCNIVMVYFMIKRYYVKLEKLFKDNKDVYLPKLTTKPLKTSAFIKKMKVFNSNLFFSNNEIPLLVLLCLSELKTRNFYLMKHDMIEHESSESVIYESSESDELYNHENDNITNIDDINTSSGLSFDTTDSVNDKNNINDINSMNNINTLDDPDSYDNSLDINFDINGHDYVINSDIEDNSMEILDSNIDNADDVDNIDNMDNTTKPNKIFGIPHNDITGYVEYDKFIKILA